MSEEGISPRLPIAIGLIALVPLAVYGVTLSFGAAIVAAINVVIIVAALYLAMGPVAPPGTSHG